MARKKMLNGVLVNYTAEEEAQADIDQKNWEDESAERKLEQIKKNPGSFRFIPYSCKTI